jgi:hypothetical protein
MEIRRLIREMSLANRLWGAPRIQGELLKLAIEVAQSTVAKYMAKGGRGRAQTWKTFFHNHAAGIAAMDFLVVPTVGFKSLFVLVILRHQRRRLISLTVTTNPTAEWIAREITEAFPWNEAPKHLIRDRDASYRHAVIRRLTAIGVRDHPTPRTRLGRTGNPIQAYGLWVHFTVVMLESMGILMPGETALVTAALYACDYRKLHPAILMLKSAEDRPGGKLAVQLVDRWVGESLPSDRCGSQFVVIASVGRKDPAQIGLAEDDAEYISMMLEDLGYESSVPFRRSPRRLRRSRARSWIPCCSTPTSAECVALPSPPNESRVGCRSSP